MLQHVHVTGDLIIKTQDLLKYCVKSSLFTSVGKNWAHEDEQTTQSQQKQCR